MQANVSNPMGDDLTVKTAETIISSDNGVSNTIPVLPINFAEYDPANIDVWDEYITIGNEKDRAINAIKLAKFPYLIESEKGQGKTLLIHTICKENNIALVEEPVGSGTKKYDLIGSKEINKTGPSLIWGYYPRQLKLQIILVMHVFTVMKETHKNTKFKNGGTVFVMAEEQLLQTEKDTK